MKINIIVCTFNRAEKLRKTIESIFDAEVSGDIEVELIVVNNSSLDNTNTVIKELSHKVSQITMTYLFEDKQGKSYALNAALKHITGDIIAFTDDDVIVDKYWIKGMVNAVIKYPDSGCFGGRVIAVYPEDLPKWFDINGSKGFLKSAFVDRDDGDFEVEYGTNTISKTPGGVNMFFRREIIKKNGFFRTDLGPRGNELGFSEDTEYCQRLLDKGEKFVYIPSAVVYHPVHTERLNKGYLLMWQYKCGRSEVRRIGGYQNAARVFRIPRYLFGKFIQHAVGYSFSLNTKKRFYHKLKLYYTAGEIIEHVSFTIGYKAYG